MKIDVSKKQLVESFKQELNEFDLETEGPLPPQYRKFSRNLLNLRETEKHLLKTRRFEEAGIIKKEADGLEIIEMEELRGKYERLRTILRDKLIENYEQKMECMESRAQRERKKIESDGFSLIEMHKKTIENLEKRLEETRTCPSNVGTPVQIKVILIQKAPLSAHRPKNPL